MRTSLTGASGRTAKLLLVMALSLSITGVTSPAHARVPDLTAAEVIQLPFERTGETITFDGEAIGDVLAGGEGHVWVNMGSDGIAIGVWAPEELMEVEWLGRYQTRGDTFRVRGIYNAACDQHGGDMDVHAASVELLEKGHPISRPVRWWKLAMASALATIGAFISIRYRRRQRMAGEIR